MRASLSRRDRRRAGVNPAPYRSHGRPWRGSSAPPGRLTTRLRRGGVYPRPPRGTYSPSSTAFFTSTDEHEHGAKFGHGHRFAGHGHGCQDVARASEPKKEEPARAGSSSSNNRQEYVYSPRPLHRGRTRFVPRGRRSSSPRYQRRRLDRRRDIVPWRQSRTR